MRGLLYKYESDFDTNGILYGIGTNFDSKQEYKNPALSGLIDVVSSGMSLSNKYQFTGREKVPASTKAWTDREQFFHIDLKKYKIRPNAYTLRNSAWSADYLKEWNLEGSNDGKSWYCLKKHTNDTSLKGEYKSHTWILNDINQFYSFFKIQMTGKNGR
eukprot:44753_1